MLTEKSSISRRASETALFANTFRPLGADVSDSTLGLGKPNFVITANRGIETSRVGLSVPTVSH